MEITKETVSAILLGEKPEQQVPKSIHKAIEAFEWETLDDLGLAGTLTEDLPDSEFNSLVDSIHKKINA